MSHNVDVQMDFELMREMVNSFERCSREMDDVIANIRHIADSLESGALMGRAGDAYADALRNRMTLRLGKLRDKFEELARDVDAARAYIEEAETDNVPRFI